MTIIVAGLARRPGSNEVAWLSRAVLQLRMRNTEVRMNADRSILRSVFAIRDSWPPTNLVHTTKDLMTAVQDALELGQKGDSMNAKQQTTRCSRRTVLKGLGLAGVGALASPLILPSGVWGAGAASPNNKLNVAAIGTGGRCCALIQEVLSNGDNIVALCDVDQTQLERAAKLVADKAGQGAKKPNCYEDYRKLLETEKSLDAVLVATGSRWHAPLCVAFMKAGKHVYCEKPLVRRIAEARELIELVPKCKVATQHGTQGGSSKAFRRSIEVIQAGLLGQIRLVDRKSVV